MIESHDGGARPARSRRRWVLLGVFVVVAVTIGIGYLARRPVYEGPVRHVIVISLDTTRADHLGCYGNSWIRTPNIDALAAESTLLADYMTVVSTTLASHTSLFTGKYPNSHGVPRNGFVVHDRNLMLAEILRRAGFQTAGFLGAFSLETRFNFAQGFDHFDERFDMLVDGRGTGQNQRRARSVTDAVVAYLDEHGDARNLFLFVHYFDPHAPYDPPPPYDTMYGEGPGAIGLKDHPALADGETSMTAKQPLWLHAGEVSYMDHHIGRLLDDLKRRGMLGQALLVVTSDHGENLGDVAGTPFDHGWTAYQADLNAVCLIRLPGGQRGGTRLDSPVASIDVLPTVLGYLGLQVPEEVDGTAIDLADPDRGLVARTLFGEATKPWNMELDPRWFNNPKARCARRGRFKYIRTDIQGKEELYDLAADPYERSNLLGSPTPDITREAAALRTALEAWTDGANPLPSRFEGLFPEETIRRLQALGYLSAEDD